MKKKTLKQKLAGHPSLPSNRLSRAVLATCQHSGRKTPVHHGLGFWITPNLAQHYSIVLRPSLHLYATLLHQDHDFTE